MKAIMTRYVGQSTTRPAKYVATDSDGNTATSTEGHTDAVRELCKRMQWKGKLAVGGWKMGQRVYVWLDDGKNYGETLEV